MQFFEFTYFNPDTVMHFCKKILVILTFATLLSLPVLASVIPSDVVIDASVSFDDDPSTGSVAVTGTASQTATLGLILGGVEQQSLVDNLSVTGVLPAPGRLQETGDGITLDASITGDAEDIIRGFFFDFDFSLSNTSSTSDYMLIFQIMYENNANANTAQATQFDAFADSKSFFENDDSGNELFFTDLTSDSLGDQIAGDDVDPLTFGAPLNESGTLDIPITLPRNGSIDLFGEMELAGENFLAFGAFAASQTLSITLFSISSLNQPPSNVPVPNMIILSLLSTLILFRVRRRVVSS